MPDKPPPDWNSRDENVLNDQIAAYDQMRRKCPVAYSDYLHWSLFRHEDVVRVVDDHETFSNGGSPHLSVPNGMYPPEHTGFRQLIEPYFRPEAMAAFEPVCRRIAREVAGELPPGHAVEFISSFARNLALRVQCAFMGWPDRLHVPLRVKCNEH